MEIPCKLTFKSPMKELQKVQKYFSSALKIQIHVTNTSSNSPFTEYKTASVLHSSPATDIVTSVAESPLMGKHGLDIVSVECSQEKCVKCVLSDDSESLSSSNTATSLDSSVEPPVSKKCGLDTAAIEKEQHVVCATIDDCESTVTNTKKVWAQLHCNNLMMEDKLIIEGGL